MHLKLVSSRTKKSKALTVAKLMPTILVSINPEGGAKVYSNRQAVKTYLFDFNAIKHMRKLRISEHNKATDAIVAFNRDVKPQKKAPSIDQIIPVH